MSAERKSYGPRGGEFAGTDRFRLLRRLGAGSLGLVYHVEDVETGQKVALKTLPGLDADSIYYIKQEFRSLRGIRDVNLVELYELFVDGEHCFFTMEFIDGLRFTNYIWAQGGRPSPSTGLSSTAVTALRRALHQLALGVAALHRRRKLHRDIKPDNVLVTREGRVVLLDFDLVTRFQPEDAHNTDFDDGSGTLHYMSPEQHWRQPLTSAADWYGVGVLLYEALSGDVPFDGNPQEILDAKEALALPWLRDLAPGTQDDDLGALLRDLLHPLPEGRAGELRIFEVTREASRPSTEISLGQGRKVGRAPLVGRAEEMAALQAICQRSSLEGPALVCIEGASGIGKSELVESFLDSVGKKALILRGACHHQESVPYKAFDSLVDDLTQYLLLLERGKISVPAPRHASALTRVFPVLGRVKALSGADNLDATPLQEIRLLAFRALRELLTQLANLRPLILWIDDLQWGDTDSAALFRELLRPPDAPQLLLIASYRSEERADSELLRSLMDLQEANEARFRRLPLDLLGKADSHALAVELLTGVPGAPPIDEIIEEAAGSPFLLVELARYIAHGLDDRGSKLQGGERLKQILRHRVELLSERERTILEVVSVAGKQMDRSLVLKAAGLGEAGRRELSRLSQENLVRPTEVNERPAIGIYHDLYRQVILADLEIERYRRHHRSLAEALASSPSPDPEALLVHYRGAGDEHTARKYAWQAAERAMATLAFERAAEIYGSLLSGDHRDIERWEIQEKLGDALANAGRAQRAGESFEVAAQELEERLSGRGGELAARVWTLRRRAAEQYLRGGYVAQGVAAASQVLRAVGLEYPTSAWQAWVSMLARRTQLQLRGLGYTRRSGDEIPAVDLDRIDACWSTGLGLGWIDRTRTAAFQARGTLLALEAGETTRVAQALLSEASQLVSFGGAARRRRGEVVLAEARQLTAESDDPWLKAFLVLMEGTMAFYDARWRHALVSCRRAEEMFRERKRAAAWEVTTSQLLSLGALTYLGDLGELRRVLPLLLDEAEARGDLLSASSLASGLPNLLWLSLDHPEEARKRAEKAIAGWNQDDLQFPHYLHLIATMQIDLYLGDGQAAWRRIARMWPRLVASFLPIVETLRITLHHLRARAALAAAGPRRNAKKLSRWDRLRAGPAWLLWIAEWDAACLEREEAAWAAPLAAAVRAGVAATRGQRGEAASALRHAARLFDGLDMALYAAAARVQQAAVEPGEAGQTARRAGEVWMQEHGVVNPGKIAAMLVPGIDG